MLRKISILGIGLLCCSMNLYSSSFVPRTKPEIKKFVEIIKTADQKNNISDKIDVLTFVINEMDFSKACPCIKRSFFGVLNEICFSALNASLNDVEKLNLFLKTVEANDSSTVLYKKIIKAFDWILKGRHGDSPTFVKQLIINDYQKKFDRDVLVVLGHCPNDIVASVSKNIRNTYVVSSDAGFIQSAKTKFKRARNIELLLGKFEENLPSVVKKAGSKPMFWISNKNIKQTLSELDYLLKLKVKLVVLIDNASLFSQDALKELGDIINHKSSKLSTTVKDNIIRIN